MLFEAKTHNYPQEEFKAIFKLEKWSPAVGAKPIWKEAKDQKYVECKKGDSFGPSW